MLIFSDFTQSEFKRSREESCICDIIGHYRHINVTQFGNYSFALKLSSCDKQMA